MTDREQQAPEADDELVARALRGAGPRPALPADLERKWRTRFGAELAEARQGRSQRRWRAGAVGLAAALLLAVLVGVLPGDRGQAPMADVPATTVAAVQGELFRATADGNRQLLLDAGGTLRLDEGLVTGADGGARLRHRQADVRLASNSHLVLRAGALELLAGQLYVDSGQRRQPGPPVVVATAHGSLTHIGTQFLVRADADATQVLVREGRVVVRTRDDQRRALTVATPAEGAALLRLGSSGAVARGQVPSHDANWSWIGGLAPAFQGPDSTARGLLAWAAREQGRRVRYMSPDAQLYARDTELRGQVEGLAAGAAVAAVDQLTRLTVTTANDALVVRLKSAG